MSSEVKFVSSENGVTFVQVGVQGPAGTGVYTIADVPGLQAALDGKSGTAHDHSGIYDPAGSSAAAQAAAIAASAPAAKGVTAGDAHDHTAGHGAQIAYSGLSGTPTLGSAAALDVGTSANKVVQLDGTAKLPAVDGSQLTNLPSSVGATQAFGTIVVYGQSDVVADASPDTLTLVGVGAVVTTNASTDTITITAESPGAAAAAQAAAIAASTPVAHASNTGNPHGVTASQVGLGNVDNTSDVSKPVSTAQSTAIAIAQAAAIAAAPVQSVAGRTGAVVIASGDVSGFAAAALSAAPAETATTAGSLIAGSSGKSVVSATDLFGVADSAASNLLKKATLQNLMDLLKLLGVPFFMRFPTWPAGTGILMPSLVANSTASRTSNIVTITATAHGVGTGSSYVGFRFFYPGSPSLAAGMYDSITAVTTNNIAFSATGSDFGSESINGGAAYTTATDLAVMTIPGDTLRDQSKVSLVHYRDGGTAAAKTVAMAFGGTVVNAYAVTASPRGEIVESFRCLGSSKQVGSSLYGEGSMTASANTVITKDITADQTLSIRAIIAASGDYVAIHGAFVEVRV